MPTPPATLPCSASIVYATNQDNIETSMMLNITAESGSHAGSGHVTTNFLLQDVVLLAAPVHEHLRGYQIDGGSGSSGNVAKRVIAVAPQGGGSCGSGGGWDCSELHSGRTLAEALKGKTIYEVAPGTCYRYKDRVLTNEPLWPWPMQARIQAALESARMPTRNVTKHVAQTFGAIPAQCGGTGTPPGPTPGPGVPVPPTAVTAATTGQGVQVSWTDTVNTNATGYTVERKVGTGGYTELSTAPGADARTYLDRTPAAAQQNCYVVYTRGVAGPSGFSPEACVQGPGTTPPPGPDRTPLTCEGVLGEGGVIRLRCEPAAGRR